MNSFLPLTIRQRLLVTQEQVNSRNATPCFPAADGKLSCAIAMVFIVAFGISLSARGDEYSVEVLGDERRCFFGDHHFLTVQFLSLGGGTTCIMRPHPGLDPNGWGTTPYLHPFIAGADPHDVSTESVNALGDGIRVSVSGGVSRSPSDTYGTWALDLTFQYNPADKRVSGSGSYSITLPGTLLNVGDLNLYRIASNYLQSVPLLTCVVGNTGDMSTVDIIRGPDQSTWAPPDDSCPGDISDEMLVRVNGNLNIVNTIAQGHPFQIAPAYKPTVAIGVELTSAPSGIPLIFCGFYDEAHNQDYASDNVGINAVVLSSSPATQFTFSVTFDSTALPGDEEDQDFDAIVDSVDPFPYCPTYPGNLTCPGAATLDLMANGSDIQRFVECLIGGTPSSPGCGCADMDANNVIDTSDTAMFVGSLLGIAPTCP